MSAEKKTIWKIKHFSVSLFNFFLIFDFICYFGQLYELKVEEIQDESNSQKHDRKSDNGISNTGLGEIINDLKKTRIILTYKQRDYF